MTYTNLEANTNTTTQLYGKNCFVCYAFKGSVYDFMTAVTHVLCVLHINMYLQFIRFAYNNVTHIDTLILK